MLHVVFYGATSVCRTFTPKVGAQRCAEQGRHCQWREPVIVQLNGTLTPNTLTLHPMGFRDRREADAMMATSFLEKRV